MYAHYPTLIVHVVCTDYPDYDGGSQVTEFEVLMTNSDSTSRIVYAGPDFDCAVAGLTAGKTYIFQVRALNKAGVSFALS